MKGRPPCNLMAPRLSLPQNRWHGHPSLIDVAIVLEVNVIPPLAVGPVVVERPRHINMDRDAGALLHRLRRRQCDLMVVLQLFPEPSLSHGCLEEQRLPVLYGHRWRQLQWVLGQDGRVQARPLAFKNTRMWLPSMSSLDTKCSCH
jgi:hypothetical protein